MGTWECEVVEDGSDEVRKTMPRTFETHYCSGDEGNSVAFVFACPGGDEAIAKQPVSGATGDNLDALLAELHRLAPTMFPSTERYAYRITNSVTTVFPNEASTRTTPPVTSVRNRSNILRISHELTGMTFVIFFGKEAEQASILLRQLTPSWRRLDNLPHLGNKGIRNYYRNSHPDMQGVPRRIRDAHRLHLIAQQILLALNMST